MKRYIPFLGWIRDYSKSKFAGDFPSGLTVGIMLIPQGMAYAMIAGLPPVYGLYASLVPQVVYAFLGTSRQLAVGPVAMDSLLVASGLSVIASAGSEHYILMAITLALFMGLMQVIMGVFRLGFLVNFLSKPVISGFTSAAALIIGLNQLTHLIGVNIIRSNQIHLLFLDTIQKLKEIHWITFIIGLGGIIMIKLIKKFASKFPAALIVVVIGTLTVVILGLDRWGVKVIGNIPKGLPSFSINHFSFEELDQLVPIALTLSLIAFMEAISVAKAIEQKHRDYRVDANRELIALGASNIIGSLFQSYPVTGGFSRTAVNDQAGAKTSISAIISAAVVALTLLFLTPLFYNLPKAVLASIIMVAVFGLIDLKYPLELWKKKRKEELVLLIITFIITLTVGIKEGILLGIVSSLVLFVYRSSRSHIAVLGRVPQTQIYRNIQRFPKAETLEDVLIVRFDAQLYFSNAEYFKRKITRLVEDKGKALKLLIISAEGINYIDSSAMQMLTQLLTEIRRRGVKVSIVSVIGPVRDILKRGGMTELLGKDHFFNTIREALRSHLGISSKEKYEIASQTNVT